jgi:hypothetical protein
MPRSRGAIFELARQSLGVTQNKLGEMLGVSRRTAQRYAKHGINSYYLPPLARLVHPRDADLARDIALAGGTTPEALGLVPPPPAPPALSPPPPPAPPLPASVVDAVVCAAADAMNLLPRDVRPGLLAAFVCAGEVGLSIADAERALRAKLAPPPSSREKGTSRKT